MRMDFFLKSSTKAKRENGIKLKSRTLLDLDCADDTSVLDDIVSEMTDILEALKSLGEHKGEN